MPDDIAPHDREILALAFDVVTTFSRSARSGPWQRLSCREVDALGDLMRACGEGPAADAMILEHAKADVFEDDAHHHLYPT